MLPIVLLAVDPLQFGPEIVLSPFLLTHLL
jgi:hypothetical protein